jgi:copper chaperone CopZ
MQQISLITVLMLASLSMGHATPPAVQSIQVVVKGMVCSFCVQGVEKKVGSIAGVDTVKVDLKAKVVTLTTQIPTQITDELIREAILAAGYNVERIVRPDMRSKDPSTTSAVGILEAESNIGASPKEHNANQEVQP